MTGKAVVPFRKGRNENTGYTVEKTGFKLDAGLTAKLQEVAVKSNATISMVVHAVWGILLQRYNNTNDVVFGSVISGRPSEVEGIEKMVGLFINTIPVRIRCDGDQPFSGVLQQTAGRVCDVKHVRIYSAIRNTVIGTVEKQPA